MNIINKEISIIKKILENSFVDPLPNNVLKNFVSNGSKFVRSNFALLYLKSQNLSITEDILDVLVAGEIIHNASLLHDDVIDNANLRRGELVLAKKYNAKLAILSGDYLLTIALDHLLNLDNSEIIKVFKNATKKMSEAEIKQYFLCNKKTSEKEYMEIIAGKTASLFSAILESCAILLNISREDAKSFGEYFGICFQINNDLNLESENADKKNGTQTAKNVLGIEKTSALLDNYKEEMSKLIRDFPNDIYKKGLKDLFESL